MAVEWGRRSGGIMAQADRQGPASEFNGDVGALVHRAMAQLRKLQPETASNRFEEREQSQLAHPADFRDICIGD